jgi:hypothetical protein
MLCFKQIMQVKLLLISQLDWFDASQAFGIACTAGTNPELGIHIQKVRAREGVRWFSSADAQASTEVKQLLAGDAVL